MNLDDFLLEQKMKSNPDLLKFFNSFTPQVFTQGFLNKINKFFPNLEIRETNNKNKNLAAYTNSYQTIFVNKPVFGALSRTEQASILLHEFLHVLQYKKSKEIRSLSREVWKLLSKNKLPDAQMSQVVIGRMDIKNKFINKDEVLPYLMNEPLRWEYLKPGTNEELRELLRRSKVFQVDSRFWQERLK